MERVELTGIGVERGFETVFNVTLLATISPAVIFLYVFTTHGSFDTEKEPLRTINVIFPARNQIYELFGILTRHACYAIRIGAMACFIPIERFAECT